MNRVLHGIGNNSAICNGGYDYSGIDVLNYLLLDKTFQFQDNALLCNTCKMFWSGLALCLFAGK